MKALFNMESVTGESEKSLRFIIDNITKNLRGLKSLEQPVEYWDTIIIHLAVNKLDNATSRKWEEYKSSIGDIPTLQEFFRFSRDRADVIESSRSSKLSGNNKNERTTNLIASAQVNSNRPLNCVVCKQDHRLFECTKFISMSLTERKKISCIEK